MGGVILTPAVVTARSVRGTLTLKTPSWVLSSPLPPVSCSILAVSSAASAAPTTPHPMTMTRRIHTGPARAINNRFIRQPPDATVAVWGACRRSRHRARHRRGIPVLTSRDR